MVGVPTFILRGRNPCFLGSGWGVFSSSALLLPSPALLPAAGDDLEVGEDAICGKVSEWLENTTRQRTPRQIHGITQNCTPSH